MNIYHITHASLMLKQGIHPKVVQERLGHSRIQMTIGTYSLFCTTAVSFQCSSNGESSILAYTSRVPLNSRIGSRKDHRLITQSLISVTPIATKG